MKNSYSTGHDHFNNAFIKLIINGIADPLAHIFNCSFEFGIVPEDMKIAKIIPLHKGDNPELVTNYRPISILPSI